MIAKTQTSSISWFFFGESQHVLHFLKAKLIMMNIASYIKHWVIILKYHCYNILSFFWWVTLFKDPSSLKTHFRSATKSGSWKHFQNKEKCFYFALKVLFVLKIFEFFSWLFGHVEKQLDEKAKVSFIIYDTINWETNNCKTNITEYPKYGCL